jgi:hypothetical protein
MVLDDELEWQWAERHFAVKFLPDQNCSVFCFVLQTWKCECGEFSTLINKFINLKLPGGCSGTCGMRQMLTTFLKTTTVPMDIEFPHWTIFFVGERVWLCENLGSISNSISLEATRHVLYWHEWIWKCHYTLTLTLTLVFLKTCTLAWTIVWLDNLGIDGRTLLALLQTDCVCMCWNCQWNMSKEYLWYPVFDMGQWQVGFNIQVRHCLYSRPSDCHWCLCMHVLKFANEMVYSLFSCKVKTHFLPAPSIACCSTTGGAKSW